MRTPVVGFRRGRTHRHGDPELTVTRQLIDHMIEKTNPGPMHGGTKFDNRCFRRHLARRIHKDTRTSVPLRRRHDYPV